MKKKMIKPPRIALWILERIVDKSVRYSAMGDFEEQFYSNVSKKGLLPAQIRYWQHLFIVLPSAIIYRISWRVTMFRNYFLITMRILKNHKGYSFINIAGLAVGLASCFCILLWVQEETGFNRFHENCSDIYRTILETSTAGGNTLEAGAPSAVAPTLKASYPEIVNATRYIGVPEGWLVQYEDKVFMNDRLGSADPAFFKIFTFPFIQGDPETALQNTYSMVITADMATKYFGNDNPLGKVILIHGKGFQVTGVLENIPSNSHFRFDFIFPISFWQDSWGMDLSSWEGGNYHTYIQLRKHSSVEAMEMKVAGLIQTHNQESRQKIILQPLSRIHLHSNFQNDLWGNGNYLHVILFSLTAFVILIIACINFMNLSTARSTSRAKEIGMRKVAGAKRIDIIKQFIGESILLSSIALVIALALTLLFLPAFNTLTNKQFMITSLFNTKLLVVFGAVPIFTGLASGSYPALVLSAYQPVNVLKGARFNIGEGRIFFRKVLVVCQFIFTVLMIISSLVIYRQFQYMQGKSLGFDKEAILFFPARGQFGRNYDAARTELLKNPLILHMTKSMPPYGFHPDQGITDVDWEGKHSGNNFRIQSTSVDYDYIQTFNMEMAEGRFFSRKYSTDKSNYVLNETAARAIDEFPVGKRFTLNGQDGRIIGVIKDFHQSSLHYPIMPLVLKYDPQSIYVCIKLDGDRLSEAISFLESKWKELVRGYPFQYDFLDEKLEKTYHTEKQISAVFKYFTFLTIFVACLGLFGLASFTAEQSTKEIGIRKVFGASVSGVVIRLAKKVLYLVLAANIIAWPIGYFLLNRWIYKFSYRIDIEIWTFFLAGGIAIIIASISVGYQTIIAAKANPADSLRYE